MAAAPTVGASSGQGPGPEPVASLEDSFARFIPADARAFLEIRDFARLGTKLLPRGGWVEWTRLAAGQTSQPAVTVEWGQRVSRILGMTLPEAIQGLFGRHVALAAPSYHELAEGVVLAQAPDAEFIQQLIAKNKAKKQLSIAKVPCYLLAEGLSLAVKDTVVVLGQRPGKTGLFWRTVALLGGKKAQALAGTPSFVTQAAQLPAGGQGLLYLDLTSSEANPPAGKGRGSDAQRLSQPFWSSLRRVAVGLYQRDEGVDLEIRGLLDRPVVRGGLKDVSLESISRLPKSTLLVWSQTADLAGMYRQVMANRDPQQAALRLNLEVVRALLDPVDLEKDFLEKLGPQVMLVCGYEHADERRSNGSYDLPLVAMMIESRDAKEATVVLERLAERFLGWMKVQFTRAKRSLDLSLARTTYRGTVIYRIPLGNLLGRNSACPYIETMELCWAGAGGWLIVATHPDHIRQLIDAQQAPTHETLVSTAAFASVNQRRGVSSLLLARPADTANVLQSWIDYCSIHAPHVFEPLWWKRMMVRRAGRRVELGIIIKQGAEPGRVVVGDPVLPEMPAAGRLKPGDKICAVDGMTLSEDHPEDDLRDFVAMRKGRGVVLRVERAGKLLDVRIPLSPPVPLPIAADIDPIGSMRHLIGLGRGVSVAGYVRSQAEPHQFNATLVLRMKQGRGK